MPEKVRGDYVRHLKLKSGRDFRTQAHGMAQQIRNKASRKGFKVSILIDEHSDATYLTVTISKGTKRA